MRYHTVQLTFCILPFLHSVSSSTCGLKGEAVEGICMPYSLPSPEYELFTRIPLQLSHIFGKKGHFYHHTDFGRNCSVVGHSESLLNCSLGSEIDATDSVYRIGFVPLSPYAKQAGTRVTYTLCRSVSCQLGKEQLRDSRGFRRGKEYQGARVILQQQQAQYYKRRRSKKYISKQFILWEKSEFSRDIGFIATEGKWNSSTLGQLSPTTGFHLSLDLLSSGACKSVNMYGFGDGLKRYTFAIIPDKDATSKQMHALQRNIKVNHNTQVEKLIVDRLQGAGFKIGIQKCAE